MNNKIKQNKMKKVSVLIYVLLLISTASIAKDAPILGNWLLTKVEMEGKTQELYSAVKFKDDGYAEMEGRVFGTWVYNSKSKSVTIESEMIKEFAGEWKFTKSGKNDVLLSNDKTKLFLMKLDMEKIGQANKKSGFIGVWKMNLGEGQTYFKFEAPNNLSMYTKTEYGSSKGGGTWMYDNSNNSIILVTNNRELSGNSKVISISSTEFILEKNGNTFTGVKIESDSKGIEVLSFTTDDIIESMNDRRYEVSIASTNNSWLNPEAKTSYLKNITHLKYKYSSLLEGIDVFIGEEITAKVEFNEDYEQITIEPIFGDISAEDSDENNPFYPIYELDEYRVTGDQTITVPAGTFSCKVIESIGDYGDQKEKYYMISNRPGVYAKIVLAKGEGDEQNYSIYELTEIDGNYENREEKEIIGKWLMVESKESGKGTVTSLTMEFINDGRLSINNTTQGNYSKWTANEENKTVALDFDGEILDFNITKLTDTEMVLHNETLTYYLIKWDNATIAANNKKSTINGYWMMVNGDYEYSVIEFSNDNTYSELEEVREMPIDANYKRLRGKWMHIAADSLLVFSNIDQQASFTGSYKITKLEDDVMVLSKHYVYIKIDPEIITKNNEESGIQGVWKIKSKDGSISFYEFKAPYEFKKGESEEYMNTQGIWFYNPESKILFVGVAMHVLGGSSKISEITADTIKFENGIEAKRVK